GEVAVLVADRRHGVFDGDFLAVAADEDRSLRQRRQIALRHGILHALHYGTSRRRVDQREHVAEWLADRLLSRPTGQLRSGPSEESDMAGAIGAHDAIADRGERDLCPLLLEVQLCLGFLAPADIADGPDAGKAGEHQANYGGEGERILRAQEAGVGLPIARF